MSEKTFVDKKFCNWCGAKLKKINNIQLQCEACSINEFHNPKPAVVCIITNERGEVLVATRAHDPGKGKIDSPGGFIDAYETAEQAAVRELKEELGLDIDEQELELIFTQANKYPYQGIVFSIVDIYFRVRVSSSVVIKPQDDVATIHWQLPSKIDYKNFWSPQLAEGLNRYFKNQNML
ncbi:NUDIX domain-containing protein [Candidatus Saccharibacteria bacterium]|nr:NUDIX domain-containing protein [Candidatus Saccharibacteria bacterium]